MTRFNRPRGLILTCAVLLACSAAQAQPWVTVRKGAASNDHGSRTDAIIRSEIINIKESPARFNGRDITYVHPSGIDLTRKGTVIIGFNGGQSEGEGNQLFITRKPAGEEWSTPVPIEKDKPIDFGMIYQPRNVPEAPVLCCYWFGGFRHGDGAIRVSHNDGETWSKRTLSPDSPLFKKTTMRLGMNHPLEWPDGTLWLASAQSIDGPHASKARTTIVPPDNYDNTGDAAWRAVDMQGGDTKGHYLGDWLVLGTDAQGRPQDVMRMSRTNFNLGTFYRRSTDGGNSWGDWKKIRMEPQPTNGMSCCSLHWDDADSPLHGWHVVTGSWHGTARSALVVGVTRNPTGSWKEALRLNLLNAKRPHTIDPSKIPSEVSDDQENADPTIFLDRDGNLHLLFTGRGGDVLKYYVIDPYQLVGVPRR